MIFGSFVATFLTRDPNIRNIEKRSKKKTTTKNKKKNKKKTKKKNKKKKNSDIPSYFVGELLVLELEGWPYFRGGVGG